MCFSYRVDLVETTSTPHQGSTCHWKPFHPLWRRQILQAFLLMKFSVTLLTLASLFSAGTSSAQSISGHGAAPAVMSPVLAQAVHNWIADEGQNLCGISRLKRVTNPAKVNYDALMHATPQMVEMRGKGIKPDSIEGKTLREAARKLIVTKAQIVQREGGFDGIWKAIAHRDKRVISDVTARVIALY